MSAVSRRRFLIGAGAGAGAIAAGSLSSPATAETTPSATGGPSGTRGPSYSRMKKLVDKQLDRAMADGFQGMVIGALSSDRQYAAGAGRTGGPGSPAPTVDTVFQIGSISKTLTSTVLALAALRGEVALDDPLADHMPGWLPGPPRGDAGPILLEHLATHSSGLPALPPGIDQDPDFDPRDPYAGFSREDLATAVSRTVLASEPGVTYTYSNYGAGLLGLALADRAGTTYHDLVRRRVTQPLRMRETTLTLDGDQKQRKAQGHLESGAPQRDWWFRTMAAAGGHYGTIGDLLRYLRALLGDCPPSLEPALALAATPRYTADETTKLGLAWHMSALPGSGRTAIWHTGATGGFRAFVGYCERGAGIAILTNMNKTIDPLAVELLDQLNAQEEPKERHHA